MCHSSCATCSGQQFTACLSCYSTNLLYQSSCYCNSPWNNDCTSENSFQGIFRICHSFLILSFILLIILYCLKVKLPLTYRLLSGIQAMSILIYSRTIYFDYEDFFVLKLFNLLSGPFQVTYRLESLSTNHALQTYILLAFFVFLLFFLYFPSQVFHKQSESFWVYLKQNCLEYIENFYYFGGKMMFFYIGAFIQTKSSQIFVIVHLCIFCILILGTFVRLVYEYHKNNLSQQIYQGPLYLYSMLVNAAMIGLPLVGSSDMLVILYCVPLGLLILIAILNKQMKIVDKNTIKFIIVQVLMVGLSISVILFNQQIKTYILLITLVISIILIIAQVSLTYYGGVQLGSGQIKSKGRNKINPMPIDQNNYNSDFLADLERRSVEDEKLKTNSKKGKYF